MADFVFNVAKGRAVQLALNVDTGSPANSRLIVIPIASGTHTDATIKDFDTFSQVVAASGTGGAVERSSWGRKTLTATDVTVTLDDTADTYSVDVTDQTWTAVASGAGVVTDLVICYDPDATTGTDADLIPLVQLDFSVTPDGSDVLAVINAAGILTAS